MWVQPDQDRLLPSQSAGNSGSLGISQLATAVDSATSSNQHGGQLSEVTGTFQPLTHHPGGSGGNTGGGSFHDIQSQFTGNQPPLMLCVRSSHRCLPLHSTRFLLILLSNHKDTYNLKRIKHYCPILDQQNLLFCFFRNLQPAATLSLSSCSPVIFLQFWPRLPWRSSPPLCCDWWRQ